LSSYDTEVQTLEVSRIETDGLILDVGGGGEGIIGRLNGKQVVAIDTHERELVDTCNEALKVVMDAADLKFLPKSFEVCTAFFSLMYIPKSIHQKVFEEVFRVLKDNGKFLIWDARIPDNTTDYKTFIVHLKVKLPHEEVKTGYGVKWQTQSLEYFKEIAKLTGFKLTRESSKNVIFHLELQKKIWTYSAATTEDETLPQPTSMIHAQVIKVEASNNQICDGNCLKTRCTCTPCTSIRHLLLGWLGSNPIHKPT
jgi:ubiquinone/menaquinone biosynthesis C-methylase UbiE